MVIIRDIVPFARRQIARPINYFRPRQRIIPRQTRTRVRIINNAPRKSLRKRINSVFDFSTAFDDIFSAFKSSFNKPVFVLMLAVCIFIIYSHQNFSTGKIGKWVEANKNNNSLAEWIDQNKLKFMGSFCFIPGYFNLNKSVQSMYALGTFFWVFLIPEASIYEYAFQAVCIDLYFKINRSSSRTVLIVLAAAFYWLGWFSPTSTFTNPNIIEPTLVYNKTYKNI